MYKCGVITFSVFVLILSVTVSHAESKPDAVDRVWKARGLQALEKLEALAKKNGASKGKNLSKKDHCEWSLEKVFISFAHPELWNIVRKPLNNAGYAYNMVFMNEGKTTGQIGILYSNGKNVPWGIRVSNAKVEDFETVFLIGAPAIFVNTPTCIFTIPTEKPYEATAEVRQ